MTTFSSIIQSLAGTLAPSEQSQASYPPSPSFSTPTFPPLLPAPLLPVPPSLPPPPLPPRRKRESSVGESTSPCTKQATDAPLLPPRETSPPPLPPRRDLTLPRTQHQYRPSGGWSNVPEGSTLPRSSGWSNVPAENRGWSNVPETGNRPSGGWSNVPAEGSMNRGWSNVPDTGNRPSGGWSNVDGTGNRPSGGWSNVPAEGTLPRRNSALDVSSMPLNAPRRLSQSSINDGGAGGTSVPPFPLSPVQHHASVGVLDGAIALLPPPSRSTPQLPPKTHRQTLLMNNHSPR